MPAIVVLPRATPLVSVSNDGQYPISGLPFFLLLYTPNITHPMSISRHAASLVQQYPCEMVIVRGNSLKQKSGILGKLSRITVL